MNDLLPGLRAALAREEAASAARSTAEVELAATGSTPSPSAEPTRAERFMDDASAVADAMTESGDAFTLKQMFVQRIPKSTRTPEEELDMCGLSHKHIVNGVLELLGVGAV